MIIFIIFLNMLIFPINLMMRIPHTSTIRWSKSDSIIIMVLRFNDLIIVTFISHRLSTRYILIDFIRYSIVSQNKVNETIILRQASSIMSIIIISIINRMEIKQWMVISINVSSQMIDLCINITNILLTLLLLPIPCIL